MKYFKLDEEAVRECAPDWAKREGTIEAMQVAVYVMCEDGMLGRLAACQPADFYIDKRVGRLPYPKRIIEQAVKVLAIIAEAKGLNAHNLPDMPMFHNCGIF